MKFQSVDGDSKVLWRSNWRMIRQRLGYGCNDLVSTADLLAQLQEIDSRDLGLRWVPLDRIVGSSRPQDFDLKFKPKRREENGRWSSVATAVNQGEYLPPPLLLKVQNSYFVVDGNHRISVARGNGWEEIEARVTEVAVNGLETKVTCNRLGFRVRSQQSL